ncbi:hypothetical protein [Achromobacter sp. DH1f]|uniref:hypothetical protein n=1 Tax=Achromobacter sp. DH1f TaxID=1397275 RepID=UPI0012FE8950|nr:hypothetical protein [Achromobacter sp. DH1f]
MSTEKIVVNLGEEYDDDLRDAIAIVLSNNNAIELDRFSGVGGSQYVERLTMKMAEGTIIIEAETFIGLKVFGPRGVVDKFVKEIKMIYERGGSNNH